MQWYIAHLITVWRHPEKEEEEISVWEDLLLFQAKDAEKAAEMADAEGKRRYADDPDYNTVSGHKPHFVGVREIISLEGDENPRSGVEVSFLTYCVKAADLDKLARNEPVAVTEYTAGIPADDGEEAPDETSGASSS